MNETLLNVGSDLMAKFMNVKVIQSKTSMAKFYHSDEFTKVNGKLAFSSNLKFHSDWNWLQDVINKINNYELVTPFHTLSVKYEMNKDVIRIIIIDNKDSRIFKVFNTNSDLSDKKYLTFIVITNFLLWSKHIWNQ